MNFLGISQSSQLTVKISHHTSLLVTTQASSLSSHQSSVSFQRKALILEVGQRVIHLASPVLSAGSGDTGKVGVGM